MPAIAHDLSGRPGEPIHGSLHLPVQQFRYHLAEALEQYKSAPTVIIVSDTGSGKTTQIPQILLDKCFDGFFDGSPRTMAITQPRRVAAMSVAQRVASEQKCHVGELVGYSVRFDDRTSKATRIKYMTDGMLVREAHSDWMFKQYGLIILDEVHERSLQTDVLLGLVRKAQIRRKKFASEDADYTMLKVILMSATMEIDRMRSFWKDAPVLYIPGRSFPVEINFVPAPIEDYIYASMVSVFQIHRFSPAGDVLVFVTGSEEIEDLIRRCRQVVRSLPENQRNIVFVPLYANLPTENQMRALNLTPGIRKVIFSTNVAETSVTIPGIKYVIDTGRVKSKSFTSATGMELLKVQTISQAQGWQRTGRAGREQPGVCYRLYTEKEFESWPEHSVPEILRSNLSSAFLQLVGLGVKNPLKFLFVDPPDENSIRAALDQLEWLGAVKQENEGTNRSATLTAEGIAMVLFPLDPRYSKCILRAKAHNCTEDMLTIIAMFSADSPFMTPIDKRKEAAEIHAKFVSNEGDPITMLNIWRAYRDARESELWCSANFLNSKNLRKASKIRAQLRGITEKAKISSSVHGMGTTALRKAWCEGMFMNAVEMLPDGSYVTLDSRTTVFLHPSSALFNSKPSCLVYNELVQTTKTYVRELCLVEKEWVEAAGKTYFVEMKKRLGISTNKISVSAYRERAAAAEPQDAFESRSGI